MRAVTLGLRLVVAATAAFVLVAGASACGPSSPAGGTGPEAPAAPPVPRTSINQLMVAMVDNAGHVLWDAEREGMAPKDDADWLEIEDHAVQLAAASTLIQLGGTGQADMGWVRQNGWRDHADMMGGAAVAALEAARKRNMDALVAANGDLVSSCETCHKAFKPELPTEGIAHQRPHSDSHAGTR
mgnify:CR=1 FL=1